MVTHTRSVYAASSEANNITLAVFRNIRSITCIWVRTICRNCKIHASALATEILTYTQQNKKPTKTQTNDCVFSGSRGTNVLWRKDVQLNRAS